MNMPVAVFDLEGVLIDNSERLNYALRATGARSIADLKKHERKKFWKIFLNLKLARSLDRVNDLGLMILANKSQKYKIAIISGTIRPIGMYQISLVRKRALELNLEIRIDHIFLRQKGLYTKAAAFKELMLRRLMTNETIIELHDDDEEVIEMAKRHGIRAILWRNLHPVESTTSLALF